MEAQAQAPTTKKKKPNSPKAPGTSLRSAVAETSKLYQSYSHGQFSRGEMASALNMSANSGAFLGKAATLREYGLVDETGGQARVSELFKAIHQAPVGSAELKRNALQAVRKPSVFARLLRQFIAKIPDETALALRLETQERFNRDRAAQVAAAFRTSLTEYGLIDGNGNVLSVRDDAAAEQDRVDESEQPEETQDVPAGPSVFRVEVPLADNRLAVVALPREIRPGDIKRICAVLTAYTADVDE